MEPPHGKTWKPQLKQWINSRRPNYHRIYSICLIGAFFNKSQRCLRLLSQRPFLGSSDDRVSVSGTACCSLPLPSWSPGPLVKQLMTSGTSQCQCQSMSELAPCCNCHQLIPQHSAQYLVGGGAGQFPPHMHCGHLLLQAKGGWGQGRQRAFVLHSER